MLSGKQNQTNKKLKQRKSKQLINLIAIVNPHHGVNKIPGCRNIHLTALLCAEKGNVLQKWVKSSPPILVTKKLKSNQMEQRADCTIHCHHIVIKGFPGAKAHNVPIPLLSLVSPKITDIGS